MRWTPSQEYRYTVRAPTEGQESGHGDIREANGKEDVDSRDSSTGRIFLRTSSHRRAAGLRDARQLEGQAPAQTRKRYEHGRGTALRHGDGQGHRAWEPEPGPDRRPGRLLRERRESDTNERCRHDR